MCIPNEISMSAVPLNQKQFPTGIIFASTSHISMSLITPNPHGRTSGSQKSGARRQENNRIYAHPLPIIFHEPPPPPNSSRIGSILRFLGLSLTRVEEENPHCEGIFDPVTRSVWVSNSDHSLILWRRGFFGKGSLSRSEPSWLARQVNNNNKKSGDGRRMFSSRLLFFHIKLIYIYK